MTASLIERPFRLGPLPAHRLNGQSAEQLWKKARAGRDAARSRHPPPAARERIDAAVGAWTAGLTPHAVMDALQAVGVPAAAMLRVSELPALPYFRDRAFFQDLNEPHLGRAIAVDNAPVRSERLARPPLGPAPLVGEHTRALAADLLGLDPREIDRLIEARVLETSEAASREGEGR
ncbi:MAG: CoA transferase [Phenylobacterium sp.]|nr:CoA transferase [Phenylobacterium sp.]